MAKSSIYIPTSLKVGFNYRADTFDGKLSYVNYLNAKNQWAFDNSWNSWIDKNIEPILYNNFPTLGFVIHKGHVRYSDFSGKSSVVRIYHPHGFEFEISPANLCAILTHCEVQNGYINKECVLAFSGGKPLVIPVNSDVYQEAMEQTKSQTDKTKVDLFVGHQYQLRGSSNDPIIYLGHYETFQSSGYECNISTSQPKNKEHLFLNLTNNRIHSYKKARVWNPQGIADESLYSSHVCDLNRMNNDILNHTLLQYEPAHFDIQDMKNMLIQMWSQAFSFTFPKVSENHPEYQALEASKSRFIQSIANQYPTTLNSGDYAYVKKSSKLGAFSIFSQVPNRYFWTPNIAKADELLPITFVNFLRVHDITPQIFLTEYSNNRVSIRQHSHEIAQELTFFSPLNKFVLENVSSELKPFVSKFYYNHPAPEEAKLIDYMDLLFKAFNDFKNYNSYDDLIQNNFQKIIYLNKAFFLLYLYGNAPNPF